MGTQEFKALLSKDQATKSSGYQKLFYNNDCKRFYFHVSTILTISCLITFHRALKFKDNFLIHYNVINHDHRKSQEYNEHAGMH